MSDSRIIPIVQTPTRHHIAAFTDGSAHHFTGVGTDSTRAAVDYCDRHGCKIVTLSTPGTIYRDLQGERSRGDQNPYRLDPAKAREANGTNWPERYMLAVIGRLDVWERPNGA